MSGGSEGRAGALDSAARAVQEGRRGAKDHLARLLAPRLLAFARGQTRDRFLAEEAAQEALIRVFRSLAQYSEGNFLAWCLTITQHACIDMIRAERRHARRAMMLPPLMTPSDVVDLRAVVEACIADLPDRLRIAFLLRQQGLRYDDIAQIQAVPIGTVRSRLNEARRLLRERLASLFEEKGALNEESV